MKKWIKSFFQFMNYEIYRTSKFGIHIFHRKYGARMNNMDRYERQVAPTIRGIRIDHRARYRLACDYIRNEGKILDFACGIGYGAYLLSRNPHSTEIDAVDKSHESIAYANRYYHSSKIAYKAEHDSHFDPAMNHYDLIVSFETIEHLEQVDAYLKRIARSLKSSGVFICSTPNQAVIPFHPVMSKYHLRHYTPLEFGRLLQTNGFNVIEQKSQQFQFSSKISDNWDGRYLIAICTKL